MNRISVVINTFNAERHLERVLRSVKDFDEILVCDMHSTDRSIAIAREYGCTIVYHDHTGFVEPARNFAIQSARHPWVLVIDADEIVPSSLKEYLYARTASPDCPDGIRIPMKNYFMGRFMHSDYPSLHLRFFRKEKTYWPPFVHAHPQVQGRIETISGKRKELALVHLANDSVATNIRKTNQYTENELARRKTKKYPFCSLMGETFFRFLKLYLFKGGYKDGKAGLVYCGLNAFYKYVTIAKIWETRVRKEDIDPELIER